MRKCLMSMTSTSFQQQCSLWQNIYLITKSSSVSRRISVQANCRLIDTELFSISTWGDAVKKGYISMEGLLSSQDLCKSKWAASLKVHMEPLAYNISSPSSFAMLIEGHAVRSDSVFRLLSSLFQSAARSMYRMHMEPSHAGGTN